MVTVCIKKCCCAFFLDLAGGYLFMGCGLLYTPFFPLRCSFFLLDSKISTRFQLPSPCQVGEWVSGRVGFWGRCYLLACSENGHTTHL